MAVLLALLMRFTPFGDSPKANKNKQSIALCCYCLLFATLSLSAYSQSPAELNQLVFTPVALQAEDVDGTVTYIEIHQQTRLEEQSQTPFFTSPEQQAQTIQDPAELEDSIARYQELSETLEIQDGPYNETLGQVYLSMGTLYQQQALHAEAIDVFEQSLHLNRLNNGLFNMSQTPVIEKLIESHIAIGDLDSANDKQEYLLYLHEKEHGKTSPSIIPALMNYANWNILAFSTPLDLSPKGITSNQTSTFLSETTWSSSEFQRFMYNRLLNAQNSYRSVGQLLYENFGSDDPRLLDVEKRLALTNYLFASNFFSSYTNIDGIVIVENTMGYRFGKEALQRQITYLEESSQASKEELIRAKQELADWYLLFQRRSSAFELYQEAFSLFSETNPTEQDAINYLSPSLPSSIPIFLTEKYTKESYGMAEELELAFKGYIDLEFKINLFGNTGPIKVLAESNETPALIKTMLISKLKDDQFRPRLTSEGKSLKDDSYLLRYYYSY